MVDVAAAPRRRVRVPLLVVAGACFALAVLLVLWIVSAASDRTAVLVIANPVAAGEVVATDDVRTSLVALDDGFGRVYLADRLDEIAGAVAVVDLEPGDLLGPSVLTGAPETVAGERLVGALLRSGRFPAEIDVGDRAWAIAMPEGSDDVGAEPVVVRVVSVDEYDTGEARLTLAVDAAHARDVALWAGRDLMVVATSPIGARE